MSEPTPPRPPADAAAPASRRTSSLRGLVSAVSGTILKARLPSVEVGEICRIRRRRKRDELLAEVVGFDEENVLLMPLSALDGVSPGDEVVPSGSLPNVPCGEAVRGRVLDALGQPIDDRGPLVDAETASVAAAPPPPMSRARITQPLETGIRAIDGLLTIGRGQRVGIFAAAGVGKSTLLGMIARCVKADRVVLALIGERGREVRTFIEDDLGPDGMAKSTIVVSTSDQPSLLRLKAAYTATAIAEAARRRGEHVVLMMDSVTRFARALREVGLAANEPPGRQGYPPRVYAELPQLFERCGNAEVGSITAFYTVLVAGDDLEEPIADETISLLDGHIVLSRRLAARGHYPAIDVPRSVSRLMNAIVARDHRDAARDANEVLGVYEENYDKIICGLYEEGTDPRIDRAIRFYPRVSEYLQQPLDDIRPFDEAVQGLLRVFARGGP